MGREPDNDTYTYGRLKVGFTTCLIGVCLNLRWIGDKQLDTALLSQPDLGPTPLRASPLYRLVVERHNVAAAPADY